MARYSHFADVWTREEWLVIHLHWIEGYSRLVETLSNEESRRLNFLGDAHDEKLAKTLPIKVCWSISVDDIVIR